MKESSQGSGENFNPFSESHDARYLSSQMQRDELKDELISMRCNGYIILEDCLCEPQLAALREEFERLYVNISAGSNNFGGFATRRIFNLVSKTRVLDTLILDPKMIALVEAYLEDQIQLSICSSIKVHPGETEQPIHRDDTIYPLSRPHPPLLVNCMWAIDEFTADNGATRLVAASHRDSGNSGSEKRRSAIAQMKAGSVLLWDGALLHGGGANISKRSRLGLTVNYCRAWLRQQENQYLAIPPDQARMLPRDLQKLIGYWVANNLLGSVDNESPTVQLR